MDNQIDIIMGQHAALAAIENLTNVAVGLEMSAYDQFDLNPNIRGDEGMGVSEKFKDAVVN